MIIPEAIFLTMVIKTGMKWNEMNDIESPKIFTHMLVEPIKSVVQNEGRKDELYHHQLFGGEKFSLQFHVIS